jgi:hypothetical protein
MRIYEGDFAYEIERVRDPATEILNGWRYNLWRVRPFDQLLRSAEVASKEAAEQGGKRALAEALRAERRTQEPKKKRAA